MASTQSIRNPERGRPTLHQVGWVAAFIAAYAGLGVLILEPDLWQVPPGYFAYPPSGFALALLGVLGKRFWPAVGAGAAIVTAVVDQSAVHALATGVGASLEVVVAIKVIEARGGFPGHWSVRSVVTLLLAGLAAAPCSAALGVAGMVTSLGLPADQALRVFGMWALGHGLGIIVVGGTLMLLIEGAPSRRSRGLEPVVVFALIVTVAQLAFGHWELASDDWPLTYVIYPLLAWAALRHSQAWVAAGGLLVAMSALAWTGLGTGPLYRGTMEASLLYVAVLTASLCVGQLFLSAVVKQRDEAEARLRDLVDVMPVATAVVAQEDDGVLFLNESWKRLVGPERPTTFGRASFWWDPDTWGELKARLRASGAGVVDKLEMPFRRQDGDEGVCEVSLVRLDADPTAIIFAMDDVTQRVEQEREMAYLAFHDPLTGLANRAQFRLRFQRALDRWSEESVPFAVIVVDLDGFKGVNDTHGHDAGDQVLVRVGARLRTAVRESDLVVRLGGDEFVLLLESCNSAADAAAIADSVAESLSHPIRLSPTLTVTVGASTGMAHAADHPAAAADLVKLADGALYAGRMSPDRRRAAPHSAIRTTPSA